MRRMSLRSGLTSLVLALTLSLGCAWKGHIKQGDAFMAQNNYDAAAAEYEAALRLRPDDQAIALKLGEAQVGQVEHRAEFARMAIAGNQDADAIALAAEAYAILPDHPTTVGLIDEIVRVSGSRAKDKVAAGDFAGAMVIYDGILAGLPSARDAVSADADAASQAWIAHLTTAKAEAEAAGRPATALLYQAKLIALSGEGIPEFNAAREALFAERRYVVVAKGKGPGGQAVAAGLVGSQAPALLEVAAEGKGTAATLSVQIGKPKYATDKQQRDESVQYQSGTQQVENPFYQSAQDKVLDEERRVTDRENEVTKQEQYVSQYSEDVAREGDTPGTTTGAEQNLSNAQSRLEAARRALVDQRNQLIRAREDAAGTEQFTEEAVYSTHTFKVTTHMITASVDATAELKHADGREALTLAQPLSVSASDDTHPAQGVAGLAEDPLALPGKADLANQLYAQASPLVAKLISDSFAAFRQGLRDQAGSATDPGDKLELLLGYVVVDVRNSDPQVIEEILGLSGVPDATTLLLFGL